MAQRDAGLAHLARSDRRIRIKAVLCREIEGYREAALALFQVAYETGISLARVAETGVSADDPWLACRFGTGLARTSFGHGFLLFWDLALLLVHRVDYLSIGCLRPVCHYDREDAFSDGIASEVNRPEPNARTLPELYPLEGRG
jgi:hypothetical protein